MRSSYERWLRVCSFKEAAEDNTTAGWTKCLSVAHQWRQLFHANGRKWQVHPTVYYFIRALLLIYSLLHICLCHFMFSLQLNICCAKLCIYLEIILTKVWTFYLPSTCIEGVCRIWWHSAGCNTSTLLYENMQWSEGLFTCDPTFVFPFGSPKYTCNHQPATSPALWVSHLLQEVHPGASNLDVAVKKLREGDKQENA